MARILVIEDNPTNLDLMTYLLKSFGYTPLTATDGEASLELARRTAPDLIISDIVMPVMDGAEFAGRLHADPAIARIPSPPPSVPIPAIGGPEAEHLAQITRRLVEFFTNLQKLDRRMRENVERGWDLARQLSDLQRLSDSLGEMEGVSLRLTTLIELGLELASKRDAVALLDTFCRAAQDILTAKVTGLAVLDNGGRTVRHFLTRGIDPEVRARLDVRPVRDGVLGRLLTVRRPVRLRDLGGDPESLGLPAAHPLVRSFLGVPLATPTEVYGWLYVANKLGADEFSLDDERVAATIATQAALALGQGQAPLTEKQARYLGHVHQAGKHLLQLISDVLDLMSNAVKFTPEGGWITVTARRVVRDTGNRRAGESETGGLGVPPSPLPHFADSPIPEERSYLELTVTDSGIGIKPEDLPKLFKEFVQLETTQAQRHEGTGLGLALTKRLVELHGGRMRASSEGEGKGSRFTVVLPFGGPVTGGQ